MSQNDVDSVKAEYDTWCSERASGLPQQIDPFEVFCAEQFLKDYNLSDDDILSGIVGRSLDGGTDAFFYLVGGKCMRDNSPIPDQPGLGLHLIFMQAKQNAGFSPLQVDQFHALTDDLLDISKPPSKYGRTYNNKLLDLMNLFKTTYPKLRAPRLVIDYYYATMADVEEVGDCHRSADKLAPIVKRHFSRAEVNGFHFINAAKFYTHLFERPPFEKRLQFAELMDGTEGYIGLVYLKDFYAFLKGEDGELMERIFDDNVRGFQLETRVNRSILDSLRRPQQTPEFWLLNNGITILSPEAESLGGKVFRIVDPQIVNGLQTSRRLFDYFKSDERLLEGEKRRIIVRIIQNQEEKTREAIIRATNNQNTMPAEALYTTFRIHRQLEILFGTFGLYYERRKGYWRDKRKPITDIVSALSLVQSVVAIMKRQPDVARGRPRDYINDNKKRYSIFGHDDYDESAPMEEDVKRCAPYDFNVYLRCWQIVRVVEAFLDSYSPPLENETKRNLLYYLALWATCAVTHNAHCPPSVIGQLDAARIDRVVLSKGYPVVLKLYQRFGANDEAAKNPKMAAALQALLKRTHSPGRRKKRGGPRSKRAGKGSK